MKILHLSTLYPPHIVGGAERSVALLAENQARSGDVVTAVCLARGSEPPAERAGVTVFRLAHHNDFWLEDAAEHSMRARQISKFKQQFNVQIAHDFGKVLDRVKPEIINTHSLVEISTLVWREAARRRIPIVHTLRDYDLVCGNSAMVRDGVRCDHWHAKCRLMTATKLVNQRLVSSVASVGSEILQRHLSLGLFGHVPSSRRRVIWNAATVEGAGEGYVRRSPSGPFTFGYLGRINLEKGVGTLLEAARRLGSEDWKVVIAGRADETLKPFEAMATGLPVTFAGFLDAKDFFEQIDVLVVPSIWAEPLPRTVLESYAVGVPALGARSGGIPELIGEANEEWLFDPGDSVALSERMRSLIDAGREALPGPAAFDAVLRETTPEKVVANYAELYRRTLDRD